MLLRVSAAKLFMTVSLFSVSGWKFKKDWGPFAPEANID